MACNATIIAAHQAGTLGFALSDAGWLMPWYFGVVYALQNLDIIKPGTTPVGAVSGGSIAAASSCLGLDFDSQVMPAVYDVAAECRARAMCAGTLANSMGPALRKLFTPAGKKKALERCAASTYIYVSEGTPTVNVQPGRSGLVGSRPRRVDSSSAESFASGLVATWYIPFWSVAGVPTTTYQGQPAYEGFYSHPMPCPPGAKLCIRMSSRRCGPRCDKPYKVETTVQVASTALISPADPPSPQPGDITPGVYNDCKYTPFELGYKLSLTPGTKADLMYLFNLGKADGAAWAEAVGLTGNKCAQKPNTRGA